ncbi:MAG: TolC family protein [Elusimicrobiota bacterium]
MKYILLTAVLLHILPVFCLGSMNWEDLVEIAKKNNPRLIESAKSLEGARYALKGRYSTFLPRMSASADGIMSDDDISSRVSGSLTLFSANLKDFTSLNREKVSLQRAKENYRRTFADVLYGLKNAYVTTLSNQEEVELAEDIMSRRKENSEIVTLRYEAGREDRGAKLRAQADYARAKLDFSSKKRDLDLSFINLAKEMGVDYSDRIGNIEGEIKTGRLPDEPDIYELVLQTPEYKMQELNLKTAQYDYTLSRSNYLHDISLSASQSYSVDNFALKDGNWTSFIKVSIPFAYDFRNTYSSKRAEIAVEQTKEQLRGSRMNIIYELKSAFSSLLTAEESVSIQEKYFNSTQVRAEIAREKYLNGLISYQEWNMIENDYMSGLNAVLEAKRRLFMAHAAWKRVLGEY